ncbi:MAG: hypothetical protein NT167_12995 [Verrucomicrobia bacterium]|nr:hypothetical protein [Verrucomicrobiota bacterium]
MASLHFSSGSRQSALAFLWLPWTNPDTFTVPIGKRGAASSAVGNKAAPDYARTMAIGPRNCGAPGRLRGQITFACMCAECFLENGEGIGWGKGQIYQKQPGGEWLTVAGFPPKEKL